MSSAQQKILLDTNVILDAMTGQGAGETAQKIIEAAGEERFLGFIAANSITDIYYIVTRTFSVERAQEVLPYLFSLFSIIGIGETDCYKALDYAWDDYEDALLCVCAEREKVDILVSNDKGLLQQDAPVRLLSPENFLTQLSI
ncbi:MAG: PIN domain-containing protein [Coriobacteriia bacterium]|nr:PIN domain-containing protein [Coriobacteriia bacterium]